MPTIFRNAELFGGAMRADIPQNFLDVSNIRQVPDNQEIFLDQDGFTSIIFDILERVKHCRDDHDAFMYHLEDMIDSEERLCISAVQQVDISKLPPGTVALTTTAMTRPKPHKDGGQQFTAMCFILVRLESCATDIMITVNIPHGPADTNARVADGLEEPSTRLIEEGQAISARIGGSFEIKSWDIFQAGG